MFREIPLLWICHPSKEASVLDGLIKQKHVVDGKEVSVLFNMIV